MARLGITNGQQVGPSKTLTVQQGDTITCTAYAWLTATLNVRGPSPVVSAVRVVPLLGLGSSPAGVAPSAAEGNGPARARPQVQVGLGLLPGGSVPNGTTNGTSVPGNAQLHYTVRDDKGSILLDDYQRADPTQPLGWQQLQVGLRLQQGGTVELRVETADALHPDVYFDDVQVDYTTGTIVQEQHPYAYGAPMRGLNYVIGDKKYRHGFQGQFAEIDPETGTDDFELRNYDSRIGRWTAPDPAGQYASPYVGMGNNPVSGTDPDGGLDIGTIWGSIKSALGFGRMVGASAGHNLAYLAEANAFWQTAGGAARAVGQAAINYGLQAAVGAGGTAIRAYNSPSQQDASAGSFYSNEHAAYRYMDRFDPYHEMMGWGVYDETTRKRGVLVEFGASNSDDYLTSNFAVRVGTIAWKVGNQYHILRVYFNVHTHHAKQNLGGGYQGPSGPGNSAIGGDGDLGLYNLMNKGDGAPRSDYPIINMFIIGPNQVSKLNPNQPFHKLPDGSNPHYWDETSRLKQDTGPSLFKP